MMKNHAGHDLMRGLLTPQAKPVKGKYVLDDTGDDDNSPAADYASAQLRVSAASIVQAFAATNTDDLGEDETLADRLLMLCIGTIDADKDGEIDDDEAKVAEVLLNFIWDYMSAKGVSDDDLDALLNDWDAEAAARVKDLLADSIPTDDEEAADDVDSFAFDEDSETAIFDSTGEVIYDAAYKKRVVVRHGKKMKVMKRVSGRVRLSAKQKIAVRKMQRKAHTASATIKRIKSMKIRRRAGL
ncbi:hypothetical protein PQR05_29555 [Paraburkholderia sediminicola]|uniref:hypothetical protein n=1 Tax=Paraburkholderia sediminicola TaxID=458836 RepID=UPI0038BA1715